MTPHAGWRSRGYLPHFDNPDITQHIVFRLADALPASVICAVERSPARNRMNLVDETLDRGHGQGLLADPRVGQIVESALLH